VELELIIQPHWDEGIMTRLEIGVHSGYIWCMRNIARPGTCAPVPVINVVLFTFMDVVCRVTDVSEKLNMFLFRI
jgi:hypothetical protein